MKPLDSSFDSATRVAALMSAGMWNELIHSWDVKDWSSVFRLIIAQVYNFQLEVCY